MITTAFASPLLTCENHVHARDGDPGAMVVTGWAVKLVGVGEAAGVISSQRPAGFCRGYDYGTYDKTSWFLPSGAGVPRMQLSPLELASVWYVQYSLSYFHVSHQ